jgi:hypothetical protein
MSGAKLGTGALLGLWAAGLLALGGCAREAPNAGKPGQGQPTQAAGKKVDDHSEWWCAEHGIPEEECSMCSAQVAKECKARGDWCEKHNRAKSQCFLCDPSLKEKFAAKYRAKYGKEPPPVGDEKDGK